MYLRSAFVYSRLMRVVLALWGAAIYAWYWLGYLRGQL